MSIWELAEDSLEYSLMNEIIARYHQTLQEAKIILYGCDKNRIRDGQVVIAKAEKSSQKMKASAGSDFTITMHMMPWGDLTLDQKKACMDHELTHCGVQFEPIKERVGTKWKVVKDEYGRKQYTNDIKRDENGIPKWKLVSHDLEEFNNIVLKHGVWDQNIKSFKEALEKRVVNEQ